VTRVAEGFHVNIEQLLAHARNVEAVWRRFDAVKQASTHITQDDRAYGLLCSWIPAVLEGRHRKQDELIAYVAENLDLAATELKFQAEAYQSVDNRSADQISQAGVVEHR
jgi:hypothetical protein